VPEVFITPVAPTTTDDLLADAVGGNIESYTYKWFQEGAVRLDLQTATVPASETRKGQEWRVVAHQGEGEGWEPGTQTVTILNSAPVLGEISVTPEAGSATTEDDITATLDATDADEDTLTFTYTWSKDDAVQEGLDTDTLDASLTGLGESWAVTVTVSDGDADPVVETLEFPIGNSLPVVSEVRILVEETGLEEDFRTATDLAATYQVEDPDGDPITVEYDWTVNEVSVQDGDSATLSSDFFVRDDTINVTVTPHDGWAYGASVEGDAITIENTPPTVSGIAFSPSTVYTDTQVSCIASGGQDDDGDSFTYDWELLVNGASFQQETGGETVFELSSDLYSKHDELDCVLRVFDGEDHSDSMGAGGGVFVQNSPPVGGSVTLAAVGGVSPITTGTDLVATVTPPTDADGDTLQLGYNWRTPGGGTLSGSSGQQETLDGSLIHRGDEVFLRLNVSDQDPVDEQAIDIASNTITVENSPPTWGGFLVNGQASGAMGPLYTDTDLLLTALNPQDPDGDTLTYTWTLANDANGDGNFQGNEYQSAPGSPDGYTISSNLFEKNDRIQVTDRLSDGTVNTSVVGSTVVIVSNTVPDLGGVAIDPDPAYATDTVTWVADNATPAEQDADGDTVQYAVEWQVNGAAAGTADTLDLSAWGQGDLVSVWVTPTDGQGTGTQRGNSLAISDSPPVVDSISLTPSTVTTNTVLTASVVANDADGDGVVLYMNWKVDGGDVLYGQDADLDGSTYFDRDQVVTVDVTPYNTGLTLMGQTLTSAPLTVANSPPTAPVAKIDPLEPLAGADDLSCGIDTASLDDDNDTVTYQVTWTVDGTPFTGNTTSIEPGDTVAAADTSEGEIWECTATPSDGTDSGPSATANVTIFKSFNGWSPANQSLGSADFVFYGATAGDFLGWDVSFAGDVDGNGQEDLLIAAAYENFGSTTKKGAVHLWLGENLSGATQWSTGSDYELGGTGGGVFGHAGQPAGDLDGDGRDDVLVLAPYADLNGLQDNGMLLAVPATTILGSATSDVDLDNSIAWKFSGDIASSLLGVGVHSSISNSSAKNNQALHGGLDVSGDGTPDIIVGTSKTPSNIGRSYLILGESLGTPSATTVTGLGTGASYLIDGLEGYSGTEVELLPDVDGDGFAEFGIGAPGCQVSPRGGAIGNGTAGGAAYVFLGGDLPSPGARQLTVEHDANVHLVGRVNQGGGFFGQSITGLDDMDGDGYGEVAVGAPWAIAAGNLSGAVYVFTGPQVQTADYSGGGSGFIESSGAAHHLYGGGTYHELGADISNAGDVDNDGLSDLVVGAEANYGSPSLFGGAYLALGSSLWGAMNLSDWASYSFNESSHYTDAFQVDGGADFNGDGLDDLLIGARMHDPSGIANSGGAFLFLAP